MYSLCLVNVQNSNSLEDTIIQIKDILQRDGEGNSTGKSSISTVRRESYSPKAAAWAASRGWQIWDLSWLLPPSPSHHSSPDHSTSSWITTMSPTLSPHSVVVNAISNIQHEWICQSVCSSAVSKGREAGSEGGRSWGRKLGRGNL